MSESKPQAGSLFVISAPSGAGKTSLVKAMLERLPALKVSVSHTTRAMRPGEVNGSDYHFVDIPTFESMVAADRFVEHAKVFDNHYGTSRDAITELLTAGEDVILEIDWQGAQQVRKIFAEAVSIFILPPSRQALDERLRGRGQDSEAIIARRMRDAISEISHYNEFDYLLVNDDFEQALDELVAVIRSQRLRQAQQQQRLASMLAQLLA